MKKNVKRIVASTALLAGAGIVIAPVVSSIDTTTQTVQTEYVSNDASTQAHNSPWKIKHVTGTEGGKMTIKIRTQGDDLRIQGWIHSYRNQIYTGQVQTKLRIYDDGGNIIYETPDLEQYFELQPNNKKITFDFVIDDFVNEIPASGNYRIELAVNVEGQGDPTTDEWEAFRYGSNFNGESRPGIKEVTTLELGTTQYKGQIVTEYDAGWALSDLEVFATPVDGGSPVVGYSNIVDGTFIFTDLAPDTEYQLSISAEFENLRSGNVQTSQYNSATFTTNEIPTTPQNIYDPLILSVGHDSAVISFSSTQEVDTSNFEAEIIDESGAIVGTTNFQKLTTYGTYTRYRLVITDLEEQMNYTLEIKDTVNNVSTGTIAFTTIPDPNGVDDVQSVISNPIILSEQDEIRIYFNFLNGTGTGEVTGDIHLEVERVLTGNVIYSQDIAATDGMHYILLDNSSSPEIIPGEKYKITLTYSDSVDTYEEVGYATTKPGYDYMEWFAVKTTTNSVEVTFDYELFDQTITTQYDWTLTDFETGDVIDSSESSIDIVEPYNEITIDGLTTDTKYTFTLDIHNHTQEEDLYSYTFVTKEEDTENNYMEWMSTTITSEWARIAFDYHLTQGAIASYDWTVYNVETEEIVEQSENAQPIQEDYNQIIIENLDAATEYRIQGNIYINDNGAEYTETFTYNFTTSEETTAPTPPPVVIQPVENVVYNTGMSTGAIIGTAFGTAAAGAALALAGGALAKHKKNKDNKKKTKK